MPRYLLSSLAMLALCGAASCDRPAPSEDASRYVTTAPSCEGERFLLQIEPDFADVQAQANVLLRDSDQRLYVVESAENTVSRFDAVTGRAEVGFIDVGNDRNPYDMALDEEKRRGYVTDFLSGTLSVVSLESGALIAELGEGLMRSPSGVAYSKRYLYVSDVEYGEGEHDFGPGAVHVFDRATLDYLGKLATAHKNPHYLSVIPSPDDPGVELLVVVEAGAVGYESGRYTTLTDGGVELWKEGADPLSPARAALPIPVDAPFGAPARPLSSPDGERLYFVSATTPSVISVGLDAPLRWITAPQAPLPLYQSEEDTLHAARLDARGLLWILSYNQDALYLFDTRCDRVIDGPIDLGLSERLLEGPIDLSLSPQGDELHFITSLSQRLGHVRILPE